MKITTSNQTGDVTIYPTSEPTPRSWYTIHEVEFIPPVSKGQRLKWIPTDPSNPQGSGTLTVIGASVEEVKERKRKEIAASRYEAEISGITINGLNILTDAKTQSILTGAYIFAKEDSNYSVNWKIADDVFIPLNSQQIISIALAVRQHVQNGFDKEMALNELIRAAQTIEELNLIDW